MTDLSGLSFQMLSCLSALISERSVGRAAERMGIGQPAMSKTLARLRKSLGDPLLIRTRHGMVPTERGVQITEGIRRHLKDIESILDPVKFNPANAGGRVAIAMAESWSMLFFPRILQSVRRLAPNVSIATRHADRLRIRDWLDDGLCDIAIGVFENLGPAVRQTLLHTDELVCMVSKTHPRIRKTLTLEQYLGASHVAFNRLGTAGGAPEDVVDSVLASHDMRRTVDAQIQSSLALGYTVAQTDLVATLGSRIARHFATFLPVRVVPLPIEVPQLSVRMLWHERSHRLALHHWLRATVKDIVRAAEAERRPAIAPRRRVPR